MDVFNAKHPGRETASLNARDYFAAAAPLVPVDIQHDMDLICRFGILPQPRLFSASLSLGEKS